MHRLLFLHVEYAERRRKYGILFIFGLFCEYITLEYVRAPVIYRATQAEHGIHILVAVSQEYVNTYATRRLLFCDPEFIPYRWAMAASGRELYIS